MAQQQAETFADGAILFGAYRLVPAERALFNSDRPVRLSGRAFDLLLVLVERPGEVVSKEELIARVWPQTCVEEGNLRVHIGALRKVLSDDGGSQYVENVVGRGYSFVAPVKRVDHGWPASAAVSAPVRLPLPHARVIGRADVLRQLAAQLPQRRLVTIVGPGGMGKTTIALAVVEEVAAQFGQQVHFFDLAPVGDPGRMCCALAASLGLPALSHDAMPGLLAYLQQRRTLLVFDNCEHVIDAAAELAERLLRETAQVHILATSREPLRAEAEWVHRLPPLTVPPPCGGAPLTLAELAACPAVQLFVERATAGMDSFMLTADNAHSVADICRRLDGIPLAIELAAGRAEFFGVHGLAARLEDCFSVLTRGRRTALPRHQTLRATLDWSYDMLAPADQAMLRRFAIFRGGFTLDCAAEVAHSAQFDRRDVFDSIANLAAKSLLSADTGGDTVLYRLLGTTRAYALEKLRASGEERWIALRYARRCCALLAGAQADWESQSTPVWLAHYGRSIEHVRAALEWAFGADGDLHVGLLLCEVSAPLWYQLSLMDEYRGRLEQALRRGAEAGALAPALEMGLALALGHALLHAGSRSDAAARSATFGRALALAQQLDDLASLRRALWGCYTDAIFNGAYQLARDFAERYGVAVEHAGSEMAKVAHARLLARSMHYLGLQHSARAHLDFIFQHPLLHVRRALNNGCQFDQRISSMAIMGRVLWLQGAPEQALQLARDSVDDGLRLGHGISLCFALLLGCTVAQWSGDTEAAQRYNAMLLEHAQRCILPQWYFWGRAFRAAQLLHHEPDHPAREPIAVLAQSPYCGDLQIDVLATLHPAMLTPRAIARADDGSAGWSRAEVLRGWGESVLRTGAVRQAEQLFRRACGIAAEQGALGWELRAATSLARLWQGQGRQAEARALLAPLYARYGEGHATRDLRAARMLLGQLA